MAETFLCSAEMDVWKGTITPVFQKNSVISDSFLVDKIIGHGSFGQVYHVTELVSGAKRALKVCHKRGRKYQEKAKREATLTEYLSRGDSEHRVVQYVKHFRVYELECLLMNYEPSSLYKECRKYCDNGIPLGDVRRLAKSLLQGLVYLEEKHVLHADLKLDNILLNAAGECVISDFGLSHRMDQSDREQFPDNMHHVSIRAPEIILKYPFSGYCTDMWSAGIIILLIATEEDFIHETEKKTLSQYTALIGDPPTEYIKMCPSGYLYFEKGDDFRCRLIQDENGSYSPETSLEDLLVTSDHTDRNNITTDEMEKMALFKLLRRMLTWDPRTRATAAEALNDAFFASTISCKAKQEVRFQPHDILMPRRDCNCCCNLKLSLSASAYSSSV